MKQLKSTKKQQELIRQSLDESVNMILNIDESFTKKISSKKNTDLVPDMVYPDGVYILHETLGVKTVEGWNPKFNHGVIGILLVEDDHQIVIALEDSPNDLLWFDILWSKKEKLVNRPDFEDEEDAKSDFNGEEYCKNLNSPEFPAAYYCLNYKKGGRDWYLPSIGELWLIYQHLEEIQIALSIVGGQEFDTEKWNSDSNPWYWSSTEYIFNIDPRDHAWGLYFSDEYIVDGYSKARMKLKVRPVSNFRKNTLTESFTKKISSKKNTDLISEPSFVLEDGVYILHETLGVRTVDGWKPEDNEGVVGVLLIEDDHKIVVALEDSPKNLRWSEDLLELTELINEPVKVWEDAKSDFNGEEYCLNLNSPDFSAAYYCLNYKKGNRSWYLPSAGELLMIYNNLKEIQSALEVVGGKKFVTSPFEGETAYWSSTEFNNSVAWYLGFAYGDISFFNKDCIYKVRPVSAFSV